MKMGKVILIALIAFVFVAGAIVPAIYAEGHKCGKRKGHQGDLGSKVCKKAMLVCKNKDELGITDEQLEQIKALKIATKKSLIQSKAGIDIVKVDIKALMWGDEIDTEAINKLIDRKYELKKAKAKMSVDAYAKLKGILTKEQQDKLKDLCKKKNCPKKREAKK